MFYIMKNRNNVLLFYLILHFFVFCTFISFCNFLSKFTQVQNATKYVLVLWLESRFLLHQYGKK